MLFIYLQSPKRKQLFKSICPNLPLPPQPIITRWGLWINAANYYADNFEGIKKVLAALEPEESKFIQKAQSVIELPKLKNELSFIKHNFACISETITKLEAKGTALIDSIEMFVSVRKKLCSIRKRPEFVKKYDAVVGKNIGLSILKEIAEILETGKSSGLCQYVEELLPNEIEAFKYAPITSCDIERTFSIYKRVLEDNRRKFTFENLMKHLIIYCNQFD